MDCGRRLFVLCSHGMLPLLLLVILSDHGRSRSQCLGTHLPHPADVCLVAAEGDSKTVEFSYSVKWKPTDVELEDRMDRYMQYSTKPQHLEVWAATGRLCRADGWGAGDTGPCKGVCTMQGQRGHGQKHSGGEAAGHSSSSASSRLWQEGCMAAAGGCGTLWNWRGGCLQQQVHPTQHHHPVNLFCGSFL